MWSSVWRICMWIFGFILKSQQYAADHFTPDLINKSTCTYSHDTVSSFFFHSTHPPPPLLPPTRPRHKKKLIVIHTHESKQVCYRCVSLHVTERSHNTINRRKKHQLPHIRCEGTKHTGRKVAEATFNGRKAVIISKD